VSEATIALENAAESDEAAVVDAKAHFVDMGRNKKAIRERVHAWEEYVLHLRDSKSLRQREASFIHFLRDSEEDKRAGQPVPLDEPLTEEDHLDLDMEQDSERFANKHQDRVVRKPVEVFDIEAMTVEDLTPTIIPKRRTRLGTAATRRANPAEFILQSFHQLLTKRDVSYRIEQLYKDSMKTLDLFFTPNTVGGGYDSDLFGEGMCNNPHHCVGWYCSFDTPKSTGQAYFQCGFESVACPFRVEAISEVNTD